MSSHHHPLPSTVIEVLPSEITQGKRGRSGRRVRIEPHRFAACPQPPVEFVILGTPEGRVDAADSFQRIAPETRLEIPCRRAPRTALSVASAACAEWRGHRNRYGAPEERGADRQLLAADIRCPGSLQRVHGAGAGIRVGTPYGRRTAR